MMISKLFSYKLQAEFRVITLKLSYIINGSKQKVIFDFVQISRLKDCFVSCCEQIEIEQ